MPDTVYIVAHEPEERDRIRKALSGEAFELQAFASPEKFLAALVTATSGCVVAPVDLPGMGIRRLIESLRDRNFILPLVVLGRDDDLRVAVDAVRAGAAEFVEPPASVRRVRSAVRRAIAASRVAHVQAR